MKKILAIFLAMAAMLAAAPAFARASAEAAMDVLTTAGTIQEINQEQVTIVGEGAYKEIVLNAREGTHIVAGSDGAAVDFAKLKKGDKLTAYYGPRLTRSIPPQGNAIALVLGDPENAAMYMRAQSVEKLADGSSRVLCSNGDRLVTIRSETLAEIGDVKAGSELLVWYQMMTLSLPGQATATKAVLLKPADIRVSLQAGMVVVKNEELALNAGDRIVEKGGAVYLPLRAIAERLGYEVKWNAAAQSAELIDGARTATLTVGGKDYGKSKMRVRLQYAPELIGGKTVVPVEFFTEILDATVQITNDHV